MKRMRRASTARLSPLEKPRGLCYSASAVPPRVCCSPQRNGVMAIAETPDSLHVCGVWAARRREIEKAGRDFGFRLRVWVGHFSGRPGPHATPLTVPDAHKLESHLECARSGLPDSIWGTMSAEVQELNLRTFEGIVQQCFRKNILSVGQSFSIVRITSRKQSTAIRSLCNSRAHPPQLSSTPAVGPA